jgi:hypothetical protein
MSKIQSSTPPPSIATKKTALKPEQLNENEKNYLRLEDTDRLETAKDNQLKIVDRNTRKLKSIVTIEKTDGDNENISIFNSGGVNRNTLNRETGKIDGKAYRYFSTENKPMEDEDGNLNEPVQKGPIQEPNNHNGYDILQELYRPILID